MIAPQFLGYIGPLTIAALARTGTRFQTALVFYRGATVREVWTSQQLSRPLSEKGDGATRILGACLKELRDFH